MELHLPGCDRCCPSRASSSACSEDKVSGVLREQGVLGVCGAVAAAAGEGVGEEAFGVFVVVSMVLSQDSVLRVLWSRSSTTQVCGQGSTGHRGAEPRSAPRRRGPGGAVLRRDAVRSRCLTWKIGHYFYEFLFWETLALVFMRQSKVAC